ncbi:BON domain-containing protein [Arcicella aquatica]|uniref:BON domain-containing protein n=1 Tax=Arcicella aquatica TaxID=217141 RepID=A0ABU5QTM2_9BACT|nr:BON domain-containing protein [Arcicella aquatica]MEA5260461.1 BON domain-containing protein [Arcicella aquatica]
MKTNEELQKDVQNAIKWEPLLHAAEIGVTVKDGVVTLSGNVDSYSKKFEAEKAAKNIIGVKVVVETIEVKFKSNTSKKDDNEIADEILSAFKWNLEIPDSKIKVKVEKGWVTLEGEVHWNYQRNAAKNAVDKLMGVTGVSNDIVIKSETHNEIKKSDIENALKRNWAIDDEHINVIVDGHKVTLTGSVDSWYQKDEAARIAWNAPGVWTVDNELEVEYQYALMD